ncbi:hypothetical protein [Rhodoligotrophos defluvii]|uniref:hypothetical protein n=1 Tax=Rhodoligotrophos defluvii TaxID=2561934 RepID=UPI0010CA0347|nr:hypothetical protein [Rhodoligotrophos defluvii]
MNIYSVPLSATLLISASALAQAQDLPPATNLEQIVRYEPAADYTQIAESDPVQPTPAADLGKVIAYPSEPSILPTSSLYLTVGGGWAHLRGPATYGVTEYTWDQSFEADPHVTFVRQHNFSPEQHGWFGNIAAGYKPNDGSGLAAIELYGRMMGAANELQLDSRAAYAVWYSEGPPSSQVVAEAINGEPFLKQERQFMEFGLRLKGTSLADNPDAALSLEPFGGNFNEQTKARLRGVSGFGQASDPGLPRSALRTSEIDGWLGGVNIAIEYRLPVAQAAYLQFRTSAGAYGIAADGHFTWHSVHVHTGNTEEFRFSKKDDRSGFGARVGGEMKLVKEFFPGLSVAAVAGLDYWSRLPTARLTEDYFKPPVRTVWDDFIFVNAGVELTYEFGQ